MLNSTKIIMLIHTTPLILYSAVFLLELVLECKLALECELVLECELSHGIYDKALSGHHTY